MASCLGIFRSEGWPKSSFGADCGQCLDLHTDMPTACTQGPSQCRTEQWGDVPLGAPSAVWPQSLQLLGDTGQDGVMSRHHWHLLLPYLPPSSAPYPQGKCWSQARPQPVLAGEGAEAQHEQDCLVSGECEHLRVEEGECELECIMCLGGCEQVSEQARGDGREEKERDHVKKRMHMRGEENSCACAWSGEGTRDTPHASHSTRTVRSWGRGTGQRTGGKECGPDCPCV